MWQDSDLRSGPTASDFNVELTMWRLVGKRKTAVLRKILSQVRWRDFVEDILQSGSGNNGSCRLHAADKHLHRLVVDQHDAIGMTLRHHTDELIYLGHLKWEAHKRENARQFKVLFASVR